MRRCLPLFLVITFLTGACTTDDWTTRGFSLVRIADDDITLQIEQHCSTEARAVVRDENEEQVLIALQVRGERRGDCADAVIIELPSPLEGRAVIDAVGMRVRPVEPWAD